MFSVLFLSAAIPFISNGALPVLENTSSESVDGLQQPVRLVDEITVTATKREKNRQDVPVSLEVIDGENLLALNIDELSDLSSFVPNFTAGFGLLTEAITLRGIGSGPERSFEQAVAVFNDGVYLPRSRQSALGLFDLQRVEVMRGPQSVIHGLNATAGAVSVISRRNYPGDDFILEATTSYELEYGGPTAAIVTGGSLTSSLGARAALQFSDLDGYFTNTTLRGDEGDTESFFGRFSTVWEPSSKTSLHAKFEYSERTLEGYIGEIYGGAASLREPSDGRLNWQRTSGGSPFNVLGVFDKDRPGVSMSTAEISLHLETLVGRHSLSVLGAYSDLDHILATDIDATAEPFADGSIEEDYAQSSFEIRLASPGGRKGSYLVGLYYHQSNLFNRQPNTFGPGALGPGLALDALSTYDLDSQLFSIFAQGTWHISDRLRLVAGMRFSSDHKSVFRDSRCRLAILPDNYIPVPPGLEAAVCPNPELRGFDGSRTSDNFMPEVAVEWNVSDGVLAYAKVGTSAKAGGFAAAVNARPDDLEYDDESTTGYELGLKSRLRGGIAEFNIAVFSADFEDLQVNAFLVEEGGMAPLIRPVIRNAADANSRGIELEGRWAATKTLLVGGSMAWLDATYRNFTNAPCNTASVDPSGICDLSGENLAFAAPWSAHLFLDFDSRLGKNYRLLAGLDFTASDSYATEGTLDPEAFQDAWLKMSARVGLSSADRRWRVELIGRNLTNEAILGSSQGFRDYFLGYLEPQRSISARLLYKIR